MPPGFRFQRRRASGVEGADDVVKMLRALNAETRAKVKVITRETSNELRREARARIPRSTDKSPSNPYRPGTTRRKVFRFLSRDGLSASVGNKWFVARFLEHGTVKMAARPWLFPAFALVRPKYLQRIREALRFSGVR